MKKTIIILSALVLTCFIEIGVLIKAHNEPEITNTQYTIYGKPVVDSVRVKAIIDSLFKNDQK